MPLLVKICGLARADDVAAVAALEPDAMGFVLHPPSPRAVTAEQVADWTRDLPPTILKVGVTVNLDPDGNRRVRETAGLDILQHHGAEAAPADDGRAWKVAHLGLDEAGRIHPGFEALLIDSHSRSLAGGTGKTVDWDAARAFIAGAGRPVLLAGGLRATNVAEAIRRARPSGVDTSSGVEMEPGRKDLAQVRDFIQAARASAGATQ